jgi:hypothetical protein
MSIIGHLEKRQIFVPQYKLVSGDEACEPQSKEF